MVQSQVTNEMALASIWLSSKKRTRPSGCAGSSNEKNCPIRTLVSLSFLSSGSRDLRLKQPPGCCRTHAKDRDSNASWRLRLSITTRRSSCCNDWDSSLKRLPDLLRIASRSSYLQRIKYSSLIPSSANVQHSPKGS